METEDEDDEVDDNCRAPCTLQNANSRPPYFAQISEPSQTKVSSEAGRSGVFIFPKSIEIEDENDEVDDSST